MENLIALRLFAYGIRFLKIHEKKDGLKICSLQITDLHESTLL